MDVDEFNAGLDILGWKQTDFAASTGVSKVTVSNWLNKTTQHPLPLWAANYMRMLLKLHNLKQILVEGILESPAKLARKSPK